MSSDNKPKVIEVILKFAKLHEGVNFEDEDYIHQFFDHHIQIEFMKFKNITHIDNETFQAIVDGYNQTPDDFAPPSD